MIDGPTLLADALAAGVAVEEVFTTGQHGDVVAAAAEAGARRAGDHGRGAGPRHRHRHPAGGRGGGAAGRGPARGGAARRPRRARSRSCSSTSPTPGNAGTLVRAAEAAGRRGGTVLRRARWIRATRSAYGHRRGRCSTCPSRLEVTWARCWSGWATSASAGPPPWCRAARPTTQVDLTGPVALVLGSEAHGLAAPALERRRRAPHHPDGRAGRSRSTSPWPAPSSASSRSASGGAAR